MQVGFYYVDISLRGKEKEVAVKILIEIMGDPQEAAFREAGVQGAHTTHQSLFILAATQRPENKSQHIVHQNGKIHKDRK